MKVPFTQVLNTTEINNEITEAISSVIDSEIFIFGENVTLFEEEFAKYSNIKHCISVGNGTDALELSLRSCGIKAEDRVVVPTNSFAATALAAVRIGAIPIFVDCNKYGLMDISMAAEQNASAFIPVHLYGQMAAVRDLRIMVGDDKIIIEDSAQSHGCYNEQYKLGEYSNVVATSFYPTKNLGCYGDGGAILTNNTNCATKLRGLRNYGSTTKYKHDEIGFNSRLDEIQAAILRIKLKYLDTFNDRRKSAAKIYDELLSGIVETPQTNNGNNHIYHLYVINVNNRDLCLDRLISSGIDARIHYPIPLHLQSAFSYLGYKKGDFRNAEFAANNMLSLPMFPAITFEQQKFVVDKVKEHYDTM